MALIGCETKVYESENTFDTASIAKNSKISTDLKFAGVQSFEDVTDSSVTVSWDRVPDAIEYHVFILEEDNANFFARVDSDKSSFTLEELKGITTYKVQVRAMDANRILETNTTTVEFTTFALPPGDTLRVSREYPIGINGTTLNPKINITGLKIGEKVELFSDNCLTKVGEVVALETEVTIESSSIAPDNNYEFHVKRTSKSGIESICSTSFASYNVTTCPDGYILAPDGGNRGVSEFCVMQYEAKAWTDINSDNQVSFNEIHGEGCFESDCTTANWGVTTFSPASHESGEPWRMIDIELSLIHI